MQQIPPSESEHQVSRRTVVYYVGASSPLARALALVTAFLLLAVAFVFSLVIFSILLTAVVIFFIYEWWVSRRTRIERH